MARYNTNVLSVHFEDQQYDAETRTYSGDFTAKLGCVACDVQLSLGFHWPPNSYNGPKAVSPQMLDDQAWVFAGEMASAMCSHVVK